MAALNPAERDAVDEIDRGLKLLSLPASHPILQKLKCFCQGVFLSSFYLSLSLCHGLTCDGLQAAAILFPTTSDSVAPAACSSAHSTCPPSPVPPAPPLAAHY